MGTWIPDRGAVKADSLASSTRSGRTDFRISQIPTPQPASDTLHFVQAPDPIRMTCETIEIQGGRKLYNYTFEIEEDSGQTSASSPETLDLKNESETQ